MEPTTTTISTGGDSITLTLDQLDTMNTMDGQSSLLAELGEIEVAWHDRQKQLRGEQLQWANDALYEHIKSHVSNTSGTIRDLFVSTAHTAERSVDMTVSVFSYNTVVFHRGKGSGVSHDATVYARGWEHTVNTSCERVTVHEVFQNTDLLLRLSAMFGSKFELTTVLSPIAGAMTKHYTPMHCFVNLTFHPEGVHPRLLLEIIRIHDCYSNYVSLSCGRLVTGVEKDKDEEDRHHRGHD